MLLCSLLSVCSTISAFNTSESIEGALDKENEDISCLAENKTDAESRIRRFSFQMSERQNTRHQMGRQSIGEGVVTSYAGTGAQAVFDVDDFHQTQTRVVS